MTSRMIKQPKKNNDYGIIQRGCSLNIPVNVQLENGKPMNLHHYKVAFTAKLYREDDFTDDSSAIIAKDFEPQFPRDGSFIIRLKPEDTQIPVGTYFFDIELIHDSGSIWRICTMKFTVEGGPTNRYVNGILKDRVSAEGPTPNGNSIDIVIAQGSPIIVITSQVDIGNSYIQLIQGLEERIAALEQRDEKDNN